MEALRVLVCGGNSQALHKVARRLSDEGVRTEISTQITDHLCRPDQEWDLLLVDLDGMTSYLRGLLPAIRRGFPDLSMLGILNGSPPDIGFLSYDLELDGYVFSPPRPEDLIVRLPHLAANYLCDTSLPAALGAATIHVYQELAA